MVVASLSVTHCLSNILFYICVYFFCLFCGLLRLFEVYFKMRKRDEFCFKEFCFFDAFSKQITSRPRSERFDCTSIWKVWGKTLWPLILSCVSDFKNTGSTGKIQLRPSPIYRMPLEIDHFRATATVSHMLKVKLWPNFTIRRGFPRNPVLPSKLEYLVSFSFYQRLKCNL